MIRRVIPWTRKPRKTVKVKDEIFSFLGTNKSKPIVLTDGSALTSESNEYGPGIKFNQSIAKSIGANPGKRIGSAGGFLIVIRSRWDTDNGRASGGLIGTGSKDELNVRGFVLQREKFQNEKYVGVRNVKSDDSVEYLDATDLVTASDGSTSIYAMRVEPSGLTTLFMDGVQSTASATLSYAVPPHDNLIFGGIEGDAGEFQFTGGIDFVACVSKIYTNEYVRRLTINPWLLFEPRVQLTPVKAPAVSGATVTTNQTEVGDSQVATVDVITQVTANQTEEGDSQVATVDVITQVTANQTEEGDSQVASIVGVLTSTVTSNQTEEGDSQVATVDVLNQVSANQTEEGDSQVVTIDVITQITANQTEVGDSQVASIVGVLTSTVTSNQTEVGDSQVVTIDVLNQVSANQTEEGDSQVATVDVITQVTANQTEVGDSQVASLTSVVTSSVAANQSEAGDTQAVTIDVLAQVTANQSEAGDTQVAVTDVIAQINANQSEVGDIQIAAFIGPFINIAANQTEAGDTQVACIKNAPPPNNVTLTRLTTDFTLISKAC